MTKSKAREKLLKLIRHNRHDLRRCKEHNYQSSMRDGYIQQLRGAVWFAFWTEVIDTNEYYALNSYAERLED